MAKRQHIHFNATATLAADPELFTTSGGTTGLRLRLVTNQNEKKSDGTWDSVPFWWRAVIWGAAAERLAKTDFMSGKGTDIYVAGRLRSREYEKDGVKISTVEMDLDPKTLEIFWKHRTEGRTEGEGRPQRQSQAKAAKGDIAPPPEDGGVSDFPTDDDDLPF